MLVTRLHRHWLRPYAVALGIQMAVSVPAAAQTTAVLQGTVLDPLGGVIPAASVRIQHLANGTERAVVTDTRGHFEIVALALVPIGFGRNRLAWKRSEAVARVVAARTNPSEIPLPAFVIGGRGRGRRWEPDRERGRRLQRG